MPNGDYVPWSYMKAHEEKVEPIITRFFEVEEEVMGNERAGRKSLRQEFGKIRTAITAIGVGLIVTIIGDIVVRLLH
jgi:hypothetical protein